MALTGCGALLDLDRFSPGSTGGGGAGGTVVDGGATATGGGETGGGGAGPACTPWSQTFNAMENQVVEIVDVEPLDDCGAIIVVRSRSDVVDLVGSTQMANSNPRSWVVRLDATGEVAWQMMYEATFGVTIEDAAVDEGTVFVVGSKSGAAFEVPQTGVPTAIGQPGVNAFVVELGLADGSRSAPPEFTGGVAVFHAIERHGGVSFLAGAFEGDLIYRNVALETCSARCAVVVRDDGVMPPQSSPLGTSGGVGTAVHFTHLAVVGERLAVAGLLDGDIGLSANRGIVTRIYEASDLSADAPRLVHSTSMNPEQLTGMRFDGDSSVDILAVWDGALAVDGGTELVNQPTRSHTWLRLGPGPVSHRTWLGMTVPATFSVHDLLAPVGDDQLLLAGATSLQLVLGDETPSPVVGVAGPSTNAFWALLDTSAPPPTVVETDTLANPAGGGEHAQRATFVTQRNGRVFLAGTYDHEGTPVPMAPEAIYRDAFIVVGP